MKHNLKFKYVLQFKDKKYITKGYCLEEIQNCSDLVDLFIENELECDCIISESNPYCECSGGIFEEEVFEIIDILQFTGLYDKNGFEIYEGDIVKALILGYDYVEKYVKFHKGCFTIGNLPLNVLSDFEIKRNIYENSKLLGDKNESL